MTGPDPAVAAVRSAVRAALSDLASSGFAPSGSASSGFAPSGSASSGVRTGTVLVACSGGTDSLALAAGTATVAASGGWAAGAVVVDHRWDAGSARRAAAAAAACTALGLDPVLVRAVPDGAGPDGAGAGGPEAAARTARYAVLTDAADRTGAAAVLLGHTLDDQAETVLLGLARGSGTRSLAGMPAVRGRFRRPLLGLPRAVTAACCAALGLVPVADPANTDPRHTRVRVRTGALPALTAALGPGVAAALARTAAAARADADLLDQLADELAGRLTGPDGGLDGAGLAVAPAALRRRVLRGAALAAGSPAGSLAASHVDAVEALVLDWHGQVGVDLPGGLRAVRRAGRLLVAPPPGPSPAREG